MSDITTELLILASLVKNEEFLRKLLPFIKPEYFEDSTYQGVFQKINEYAGKYNERPDKSTLIVNIKNDYDLTETQSDKMVELVKEVFACTPSQNMEWLEVTCEEWCQQRAVFNAIQASIDIYQGNTPSTSITAIPALLSDAISVSFDRTIGMDFFEDVERRYDFYTNPESKVPFRLECMNEVTCGGVFRKTLNLWVAGVNCFLGHEEIPVWMDAETRKEFLEWLKNNEE